MKNIPVSPGQCWKCSYYEKMKDVTYHVLSVDNGTVRGWYRANCGAIRAFNVKLESWHERYRPNS